VSLANTTIKVSPPAYSTFDPLTLSLRLDEGHACWDMTNDLMMVELIASLSIIQIAETPPPMLAAPVEDVAPEMPSSPRC
jgi:hypothetical protein